MRALPLPFGNLSATFSAAVYYFCFRHDYLLCEVKQEKLALPKIEISKLKPGLNEVGCEKIFAAD
jgi:hypothetical protein